jgi:outer membrane biosynthesis protein TonB
MTESLPAALEPELRRIIDTAVARVAAIELEAIRDARELTQRSEAEARQALAFALDRAFNLINTLELLAATVSGMAEALKIELDDAIDALRNVPQPESELAKELRQRTEAATPPAEAAPPPHPEAVAPSSKAVPSAEPAPAEAEPEPAAEPEKPESVTLDAVKDEERETAAEEEAPEQAAAAVSRSNGYPPAERQAESLAVGSQDGGMVPARRRGLIRRLFR